MGAKSPSRSLIKQLLDHLAEELDPETFGCSPPRYRRLTREGRALAVYRFFLRTCVHFNQDLLLLGDASEDILRSLYGPEDEEATFITFHGGGADLGKLSSILRVDLVIYFRVTEGPRSPFYKWHDSRVHSCLVGSGASRSTTLFYRVYRQPAGFELKPVTATQAKAEYSAAVSEASFISPRSQLSERHGRCYLRTLVAVLELSAPGLGECLASTRCPTLVSLCLLLGPRMPGPLQIALEGKWLLLATHYGTGGRFRYARKSKKSGGILGVTDPDNQVFRVLANYTGRGDDPVTAVVCATSDGRLYVPHSQYAERVARGFKFPSANSLTRDKADRLMAGLQTGPDPAKEEDDTPYDTACRCLLCLQGQNYHKNFVPKKRRGKGAGRQPLAQRPFRCELDSLEYLRCFALENRENVERLKRVWRLCYAAMDAESMTEALPQHTADEVANVESITHLRYDSSPRFKQSIVVFAHGDFMDEDCRAEAAKPTPVYFRVTRDRPLAAVCGDYLSHVLWRRDCAASLKEQLLAPFFAVLRPLREAHMLFAERHARPGEADKATASRARASYDASIAGKFEKHLLRLVRTYYILAFNGKGYDFIMLAPALVSAAARREKPIQVHIGREGNQVRSIRLGGRGTGIAFRDLCDLCGRGVSLASLTKMAKLDRPKGIFPFKQLCSLESLEDPELSSDPAMWANELGGRSPTREEIAQAQALFRQHGFTSLRSWLDLYLGIDIECLQLCASTVFDRLHRLLDSHPVDVGKMTIASFSSYVSQLFLFKEKRIAMYAPVTTSLYSSLRDTTKGGLVQVSRNHCDPLDGDPDSRINAHLIDGLLGHAEGAPPRTGNAPTPDTPRAAANRAVIEECLGLFGERPFPSEASTHTPGMPELSASRPMRAVHEALLHADTLFRDPEPATSTTLGRAQDFLASRSGASWLLTERERREGPQFGRFTYYLDEHGRSPSLGRRRQACPKTLSSLGLYSTAGKSPSLPHPEIPPCKRATAPVSRSAPPARFPPESAQRGAQSRLAFQVRRPRRRRPTRPPPRPLLHHIGSDGKRGGIAPHRRPPRPASCLAWGPSRWCWPGRRLSPLPG